MKTPVFPKKHILYAVLNWGLGHASRSVPVIEYYLKQGHSVTLASDGRALAFLKLAFPKLAYVELPAYNIQYPHANILLNIVRYSGSILYGIAAENRLIRKIVHENNIQAIISDNRYGAYTPQTSNYFLTHMLHPVPKGLMKPVASTMIRQFVRPFDEIWIPDSSDLQLAGPFVTGFSGTKMRFIGSLSRFDKLDIPMENYIAVMLSGPEPQRTVLEKQLLLQAKAMPNQSFVFILGKSESTAVREETNCKIYHFLDGEALNAVLTGAKLIVCRSGYSTIMDLKAIGKKAWLIPTPGQYEQEYLAQHLHTSGIFFTSSQADINIARDLAKALNYSGFQSTAAHTLSLPTRL